VSDRSLVFATGTDVAPHKDATWRRTLSIGLFLAVVCATLVGIVAVPSAHATPVVTTTVLPGNIFQAMAVDSSTSRVFAALSDTSTVVVLNFDGTIVGTITSEAGACGVLVRNGDLYVADGTAGTIDEFDSTTLQKVRTVATGLSQACDLIFGAGALWTQSGPSLTQVNVSTGSVTTWPNVSLGALAADPANTEEIITYSTLQTPVNMGLIDLSSGTPTLIVDQSEAAVSAPYGISTVRDVAVSPDGTRVVPAAGAAPYQFDELDMSDMDPSGVIYPANPYPDAVAMTSAGGGLFAGGMDGLYDPDVVVYALDNPSDEISSYDFGTTTETETETTLPHGLAFTPDGSRLFIVTGGTLNNPANQFHVMTLSGSPPPSATTTTTTPTTTTTTPTAPTTTSPPVSSMPIPTGQPQMTASPSTSLAFGSTRLGNVGSPLSVTLTNTGSATEVVDQIQFGGADQLDFLGATDCESTSGPVSLPPGASCQILMDFLPAEPGPRSATMQFVDNEAQPITLTMTGVGTEGYYEAGANGSVYHFGDAQDYGNASDLRLTAPVISMATTPDGNGYWLLGSDGGIFSYGDANFYGSTGGMRLDKPVVGMASTPDGGGYWLVASDGGIFAYGDARFYGSTGDIHLDQPVVGMVPTPDGGGYWLVASDGGIFAFGDARFYGSTGAIHLDQPVVGVAAIPDGGGYWLVARDGGIFAFGDADFYGSTGNIRLSRPVVGMAPSASGQGYWLVASDGGIFAYGDVQYLGSEGGTGVEDIVSLAPTAGPTLQGILGLRLRAAHALTAHLATDWTSLSR
jgi:hypothetical protein